MHQPTLNKVKNLNKQQHNKFYLKKKNEMLINSVIFIIGIIKLIIIKDKILHT